MKTLLALMLTLTGWASAAEPILTQDFSGPEIPADWKTQGPAGSFRIKDGALLGVCPPGDAHGPSISVPIQAHDLTLEFTLQSEKAGVFIFLIDGDGQFGNQAHLFRLSLHPGGSVLQQDRGTAQSKAQQAEERKRATQEGRKPAVPTAEQLADPKFYRTETLARNPDQILDGAKHKVRIELTGNQAVAHIDDRALNATGTVLDVAKSKLVFLVGNTASVLIDDVKVWSKTP